MPRCTLLALVAASALACGGDDGDSSDDTADAGTGYDAGGDATSSICGYTEADDPGNAEAAEVAGVFAGTATTLCGRIDPDRASGDDLDRDRFAFEVGAEADAIVRVSAPQGSRVDDLRFALRRAGAAGNLAVGRILVDHGVLALHLSPGAYELVVTARGRTARTEAFSYRVQLDVDAPELRCPSTVGIVDHLETDEATRQHRGNDMVEVRRTGTPLRALTAATSDAPDPSGVVLSAGDIATIAGTTPSVASAGDGYQDRDTYLVATGARTNLLALRATWPGVADLDVLLFPAGDLDEVAGAMTVGGPDEALITAVAPSSTYWLWVGGAKGSAGLPAAYHVTLCAREYRLEF